MATVRFSINLAGITQYIPDVVQGIANRRTHISGVNATVDTSLSMYLYKLLPKVLICVMYVGFICL